MMAMSSLLFRFCPRPKAGASDEEISQAIERVWKVRTDRYSELRSENTLNLPKVEMSHIGG